MNIPNLTYLPTEIILLVMDHLDFCDLMCFVYCDRYIYRIYKTFCRRRQEEPRPIQILKYIHENSETYKNILDKAPRTLNKIIQLNEIFDQILDGRQGIDVELSSLFQGWCMRDSIGKSRQVLLDTFELAIMVSRIQSSDDLNPSEIISLLYIFWRFLKACTNIDSTKCTTSNLVCFETYITHTIPGEFAYVFRHLYNGFAFNRYTSFLDREYHDIPASNNISYIWRIFSRDVHPRTYQSDNQLCMRTTFNKFNNNVRQFEQRLKEGVYMMMGKRIYLVSPGTISLRQDGPLSDIYSYDIDTLKNINLNTQRIGSRQVKGHSTIVHAFNTRLYVSTVPSEKHQILASIKKLPTYSIINHQGQTLYIYNESISRTINKTKKEQSRVNVYTPPKHQSTPKHKKSNHQIIRPTTNSHRHTQRPQHRSPSKN